MERALKKMDHFLGLLDKDAYHPAAKIWFIARLHPMIEAELSKQGNLWSEVLPWLTKMDPYFDLLPALRDPKDLLAKLAEGPPLDLG
mmetsp:Transcript_54237/g.87627  ORF Transcript_54237/g.87627 Transcript_54237/m.87627 type:complete len:87 (+) Transcript_54237:122-382(+)